MSFETIARNIIRDAICSAICIDNAFQEPYGSDQLIASDEKETAATSVSQESFDTDTPRRLYEQFRKENCSLDVYRYIDWDKWESDKSYVLNNRDLLILDWELVGDPPFRDALKILREVVISQGIPFVIIYSQAADINLIKLNIYSYFGRQFENDFKRAELCNELCERLNTDTDIDESEELFTKISNDCKDFILNRSNSIRKEIRRKIIKSMNCHIGDANCKQFVDDFVHIGRDLFGPSSLHDLIEYIGFDQARTIANTAGDPIAICPLENTNNFFIICNTIVSIFNKETSTTLGKEFVTKHVFNSFADSICNWPSNFLTLLFLEMRTLYRNHSFDVGRELFEIDELAFFQHQRNLEIEDDFYDFLINCWKNQLVSFNAKQSPKLFQVLDDYKHVKKVNGRLEDLLEKGDYPPQFVNNLVQLNYFYSFLQIERKKNDRIRFGDVFSLSNDQEGKIKQGFLLCITAHCDCAHPDNIKNKYHFVRGSICPAEDALLNAEDGYFSFLVHNNLPICIKWNNRPFTVYITDDNNNVSKPISIVFHGNNQYLTYINNQMENYTQRIANEAFSHAVRVGIDYVKLLNDTSEISNS